MKRILSAVLAALLVLSLAGCSSQESLSDLPGKTPAPEESSAPPAAVPEKPEESAAVEMPEEQEASEAEPAAPEAAPEKEKPSKSEKPEPEYDEEAFLDPTDHPNVGPDYSVFNGVYRAKLSHEGATESYVQVTGYNDFITLEFFDLYDGSVFSFWVEEFWPDEDGYSDDEMISVMGESQMFSLQSYPDAYTGLPKNRCITITDDGIVLNYDDSDAEYFVSDDSFDRGHTSAEELGRILSESFDANLDFGKVKDSKDLVGSWIYWNSWDVGCFTLDKDGSFEFIWKTPREPVVIYNGAWGLDSSTGEIKIMAERAGYGTMPTVMTWTWEFDSDGSVYIHDVDSAVLGEVDDMAYFFPMKYDFFTAIDQNHAQGYLTNYCDYHDGYTDMNGLYEEYTFCLPQLIGAGRAEQEINREILEIFEPIIDEELEYIRNKDFLSFNCVDYASCVFEDILIIHVFAHGVIDWEEHHVYYIDLNTGERLYPRDIILDVLMFDENYFLDTVREEVEAIFIDTFSEIPEADRQLYGYYDCLNWTVSDEAVNLDMPIYINEYGDIFIFARIGSMAGSGIMWHIITPFVLGEG
ncbi:MAG: hypothetical protein E7430_01970 [Ruminococcaceae bacterium]|nr:hypothetical protein [Oscillospiraceae bacterium]